MADRAKARRSALQIAQDSAAKHARQNALLVAERTTLLDELRKAGEALVEADKLLLIARAAHSKLGLRGRGSDVRLSHEARMFALHFSAEERTGSGSLQINGSGQLQELRTKIRARLASLTEKERSDG